MKKVLRTFLQTACICALVVMLTMGINFILKVDVRLSYYMVMFVGFCVLSLMWSVVNYVLQHKGLKASIKRNITNKKTVNTVRSASYNYQSNNVRKRKVS